MKDFFAGYRIFGWYLAHGTFNMLLHCLLVCAASGNVHLVVNLTEQELWYQMVRKAGPCRHPAPEKPQGPWEKSCFPPSTRRASHTRIGRRAPSFSKISLAAYWQGLCSCRLAKQGGFTRNSSIIRGQDKRSTAEARNPQPAQWDFSFFIVNSSYRCVFTVGMFTSVVPQSWFARSLSHFFNFQILSFMFSLSYFAQASLHHLSIRRRVKNYLNVPFY